MNELEKMEELKSFLRVDFDEDDKLIDSLIIASENYLKNAGCIVDYTNNLFFLAIKMLTSHWYENREVIGTDEKMSYSLDSIIMQLKYCYEDVTVQ
ncbi:head-tail connector protein [Romboutsia sedimentorum]|uniref:head-tail connector protein n=1 Tax=Romboutsia sedimentorum TaxID=1368474 RepID=UPI0024DEFC3C|nr:head-tail connector protein [Romboutsia sedimentorum]MDK2587459.1 head-tail connector protein [Romboutsia sedimentorum]